jgi:KaiC/GvpD/RAD55 family RecA-like ATPase
VAHEDFTEQGWIVWEGIVAYYNKDTTARSIDAEILADSVSRGIAADKHKDVFRHLIAALDQFDTSPANVVDDLLATKREVCGRKLAAALLSGEDRDGALMAEYSELLSATNFGEEDEGERIGLSVEALVADSFDRDGLIRINPESLNLRLDGGVKAGHHILIFARPEIGKTMMVIEMIAGFAAQGLKVLYIGNEDPMDDINMRLVNRLSAMTKQEVLDNPARADRIARERGYESIVLKPMSPGSIREVTEMMEAHSPDILVLDQLRNLDVGEENKVLALEKAARQARTWAQKYSCVVVSVTQAGDSAEGKAVLKQGDVDWSNTGIPGACDLMIGLGASEAQQAAGERMISLPKNKISGIHEYFAVGVDPTLSRIYPLG